MSSREAILGSIRSHLAASPPIDPPECGSLFTVTERVPLVDLFKESLEAVDSHCFVVQTEDEIIQILKKFGGRIAISDAPLLKRLIDGAVAPDAHEIFNFDVGVSMAQAAIAETGTLVLDSTRERHRFVSLVPPVHIAIVDAQTIFQTLGEALAFIHRDNDISPAVTFITGPSRTADIELTLTIGVHGPQQLYVIIKGAEDSTR